MPTYYKLFLGHLRLNSYWLQPLLLIFCFSHLYLKSDITKANHRVVNAIILKFVKILIMLVNETSQHSFVTEPVNLV